MDDRPTWARRITSEREARGWNKPQFIDALRAHAPAELPGKESMLRRVHSWESGSSCPDDFYKPIIAKAFGTVTAAIWPVQGSRDADAELMAGTDMDTLEVITRLRASSIDAATMEALRITVDRLCSEYPHLPAPQLLVEGRSWLRRITALLDHQLTLGQHTELLSLAGWLAALVGCVEYDSANPGAAEATRQAAWKLGEETGNAEVMAWAQEMRAWFALTRGDYRGVIAAADTGHAVAASGSAAVQLHAQKAKAWARIGDRRQVEVALAAHSWSACRTRQTSITTSRSIRRNGTSTPWTVTASWAAATRPGPRTSLQPPMLPRFCAWGSTQPEWSAPQCATRRPGSPWASSPPAKATWSEPSPTAVRRSRATGPRSQAC